MWYEDEYYNWGAVYAICGLCQEDFKYDPVGSNACFLECLEKWEDK